MPKGKGSCWLSLHLSPCQPFPSVPYTYSPHLTSPPLPPCPPLTILLYTCPLSPESPGIVIVRLLLTPPTPVLSSPSTDRTQTVRVLLSRVVFLIQSTWYTTLWKQLSCSRMKKIQEDVLSANLLAEQNLAHLLRQLQLTYDIWHVYRLGVCPCDSATNKW